VPLFFVFWPSLHLHTHSTYLPSPNQAYHGCCWFLWVWRIARRRDSSWARGSRMICASSSAHSGTRDAADGCLYVISRPVPSRPSLVVFGATTCQGRIPSAPSERGDDGGPTRRGGGEEADIPRSMVWARLRMPENFPPEQNGKPIGCKSGAGAPSIPRSMSTRLPLPANRTASWRKFGHGGEILFYREGFRIPENL
jgi:hypothetical protein